MNDDIKKLFEEAVIGIEEFIDYDMGRGLYQKAYEQGSESQQAKIDNLAEWNKRLKTKMDELEKKYQNDPATIQLLECTDRCIDFEKQRDELMELIGSAAPLAWGFCGDQTAAHRWEKLAKAAIDRINGKPNYCIWVADDENGDVYETQCGEMFTFIGGGVKENGAKYCQYCGKKIKEGE